MYKLIFKITVFHFDSLGGLEKFLLIKYSNLCVPSLQENKLLFNLILLPLEIYLINFILNQ